jgi:hypothetical protein
MIYLLQNQFLSWPIVSLKTELYAKWQRPISIKHDSFFKYTLNHILISQIGSSSLIKICKTAFHPSQVGEISNYKIYDNLMPSLHYSRSWFTNEIFSSSENYHISSK